MHLKTKIYKTIIFHVLLYGCRTWFLPPRDDHRLKVFENTELKRIFGPKREEVVGGWRLHDEEFH
jgi:hypothetical protein